MKRSSRETLALMATALVGLSVLVAGCGSPATATPTPAKTSVAAATATTQPTVGATATRMPASSGAVSEAEGQWVTSSASNATNYYAKGDPRWQNLAPQNRRWFATEEELLAAYPNRKPAQ